MKKRTRIASLVAAVAMTVSALPMAALPALEFRQQQKAITVL